MLPGPLDARHPEWDVSGARSELAAKGRVTPDHAGVLGLQAWLGELSAPVSFVSWAGACADLESCWDACPAADWLLWTAARLSDTEQDRQAVVRCIVELTRQAGRRTRRLDPRITAALTAAASWAHGDADRATILAAEAGALNAAAEAEERATDQAARARVLFARAPRGRLASARTSQALTAHLDWRAADQARWTALAAAFAARTAARSGIAATAPWAACASQAASYAVRALSPPGDRRTRARAAARCAKLARRRLPRPRAVAGSLGQGG